MAQSRIPIATVAPGSVQSLSLGSLAIIFGRAARPKPSISTLTMFRQAGATARSSRRHSEITSSIADPELLGRSEEHTSELQSLMRISYAVFCLKKKKHKKTKNKQ